MLANDRAEISGYSWLMKLHVAQIGVGYWGPNLLRNLTENEKCSVRTVVEISKDRREFVRRNYPEIGTTANLDEVINDASIDAVVISTPADTHFQIAKKVLGAKKHILVEKPMARSLEEIEELTKLSERNGKVCMVGYTFLFNPAVRYVKKLIDDGIIGEIRYIYSQRVNLGRIRSDVDALWNLAPHDISIIQYWLNGQSPISVHCQGKAYVQDGINDVAFVNMVYPDGILVNVHVSWLDPNKIRRLTIVGSKKMIVYDDMLENKVAIYDKGIDLMAVLVGRLDFDSRKGNAFAHRSGQIDFPTVCWQEPLKIELDHFLDCILDGRDCVSGPQQAAKVVEVLTRCDAVDDK